MKTTIAIVSLVLLQASFFAITYFQNPTKEFAAYYFGWVLIPSTIATIVFTPRFHFVAAISNAMVATLLFDYLLLQHGYFWPNRPKESPQLAVGYVAIGAVLAFIVAGFVHSTVGRLQQTATIPRWPRILLVVRRAFVFSIVCALAAFPICAMFGPAGTGVTPNLTYLFAAIISSGLILFGTIISLIVGLTYDPTPFHTDDHKISNG